MKIKTIVSMIAILVIILGCFIPISASMIEKDVLNDYGVKLSCDNPIKNANPGDVIKFVVKIENTGTLDDTYEIAASSIEDIVCKVNGVNADQYTPYIISLGAGESITFEVTAEIGESVPKGEWIIIVFAFSQNDPTVYDELYLTVNVKRVRFLIYWRIFKLKFQSLKWL